MIKLARWGQSGASLGSGASRDVSGAAQERSATVSGKSRFRARSGFSNVGVPTICTAPPPKIWVLEVWEKKEKYTSISYLESLPAGAAAAAAVTDPLVFVTLLGDGEILAHGGRGSQQGGRGEPARERNPNLLVREKIWFAGDEGSQREQEPEAARGIRAQQKRGVARRSPRGAQDEPRRSQKSNGSPGGA